jgi:hypothetical protein
VLGNYVIRCTSGRGKRGGARVITYAKARDGEIWLLVGYVKAKFDKLPTAFLVALRPKFQQPLAKFSLAQQELAVILGCRLLPTPGSA